MALHKPEHSKWWYWVTWPFLALGFVPVFLVCLLLKGYKWTRKGWLREWENWVDDPIDYVKEAIHCAPIGWKDYVINISFLMANRKTTWKLIARKEEVHCDPEDYDG